MYSHRKLKLPFSVISNYGQLGSESYDWCVEEAQLRQLRHLRRNGDLRTYQRSLFQLQHEGHVEQRYKGGLRSHYLVPTLNQTVFCFVLLLYCFHLRVCLHYASYQAFLRLGYCRHCTRIGISCRF